MRIPVERFNNIPASALSAKASHQLLNLKKGKISAAAVPGTTTAKSSNNRDPMSRNSAGSAPSSPTTGIKNGGRGNNRLAIPAEVLEVRQPKSLEVTASYRQEDMDEAAAAEEEKAGKKK